MIWSRESGPRRYESVQRVSNTVGSASCTLCIRKMRFFNAERRRSASARSRPPGGAFEPVEHAGLVPFGLEPSEKPGAGIRQALVVEIHGVLRGEHHPEAERPPLLEQREQRRLRRRVGDRRKVAEDFVHVEDGAQAGRPALAAHPSNHLVHQQRHEEHALGVAEMGNREHRHARPACGVVEQRLRIERIPLEPDFEAGRREHAIELHGQREALLGRKERLEIDDADLVERRRLHCADERREIEAGAALPGRRSEGRRRDCVRGCAAARRHRPAPARSSRCRWRAPPAAPYRHVRRPTAR